MDYKKKKLDKMSFSNSYEEIDTRIASGWYVDSADKNKKKKYKTKEVSFKIAKNKFAFSLAIGLLWNLLDTKWKRFC